MCEFISWIEKDGVVLFLTSDDVFHTKRGKELQKFCGDSDDLVGHGAIRHFYGLSESAGTNKECRDFSTPKNFPPEIVEAVKSGKMRGMGTARGLLLETIYKRETRPKPFSADIKSRLKRIKKNGEGGSFVDGTRCLLCMFIWSKTKEGQNFWEEQNSIYNGHKIPQDRFWNLFRVKKNRAKAWR